MSLLTIDDVYPGSQLTQTAGPPVLFSFEHLTAYTITAMHVWLVAAADSFTSKRHSVEEMISACHMLAPWEKHLKWLYENGAAKPIDLESSSRSSFIVLHRVVHEENGMTNDAKANIYREISDVRYEFKIQVASIIPKISEHMEVFNEEYGWMLEAEQYEGWTDAFNNWFIQWLHSEMECPFPPNIFSMSQTKRMDLLAERLNWDLEYFIVYNIMAALSLKKKVFGENSILIDRLLLGLSWMYVMPSFNPIDLKSKKVTVDCTKDGHTYYHVSNNVFKCTYCEHEYTVETVSMMNGGYL